MREQDYHAAIATERYILKNDYHMSDEEIETHLAKLELVAKQEASAKVKESTPLSQVTVGQLFVLLDIPCEVARKRLDRVNGIERPRLPRIITDEDLGRYGEH
jgi:hypothetical protein